MFDTVQLKWYHLPDLNRERANPGSFISRDKKYLYLINGFEQIIFDRKIIHSIERLDLIRKSEWETVAI
tara:strand:+ start:338 stop:544 length:207 start_codon:yes stop_codon:yes gene_type:complete